MKIKKIDKCIKFLFINIFLINFKFRVNEWCHNSRQERTLGSKNTYKNIYIYLEQ